MSSTATWGALEAAISGDVILPGSPDHQRSMSPSLRKEKKPTRSVPWSAE